MEMFFSLFLKWTFFEFGFFQPHPRAGVFIGAGVQTPAGRLPQGALSQLTHRPVPIKEQDRNFKMDF
jgi:hypothetical protein